MVLAMGLFQGEMDTNYVMVTYIWVWYLDIYRIDKITSRVRAIFTQG